ncbi:MAG: hypothetical protein JO025_00015 [Verrucomicrobia bacterium]|nr:hypothetical protein [Verrucomicrobiota bacterium]
MSSSNLVEVLAYCRGRGEADRVTARLTDSGFGNDRVTVSGKEGPWNRNTKARQRSVVRSVTIGLPIGAVIGAVVGFYTQAGHAIGSQQYWLTFVGWMAIVAIFLGLVAAILAVGLGKLAPSPGNEPPGSGRFLVTVRCALEDKLKVQSVLVSQGAILTDQQGVNPGRKN